LAAYLLIVGILVTLSLKGYTQENFLKWTAAAELPDEDSGLLDRDEAVLVPSNSELLVSYRKEKWTDRTPDVQTGLLLKVVAMLLVVIPTLFLLRGDAFGRKGSSLLMYIVSGVWNRGNLLPPGV